MVDYFSYLLLEKQSFKKNFNNNVVIRHSAFFVTAHKEPL